MHDRFGPSPLPRPQHLNDGAVGFTARADNRMQNALNPDPLRLDSDAHRIYEEGEVIRVELKDSKGRAETLCTLAWVEIEAGDPAGAMEMLTESLGLAKAIGDRRTISEALEVAALAYSRLEKAEIATQLLGGASRVRQRIGFAMPPVRKKYIDAVIADGKSRLGEVEFQGLWQRGESHEADTLIELAARPVHR